MTSNVGDNDVLTSSGTFTRALHYKGVFTLTKGKHESDFHSVRIVVSYGKRETPYRRKNSHF